MSQRTLYRAYKRVFNLERLFLAPSFSQGGLIGLAAATVGLANHHDAYLAVIVPPVLRSFTDQDSRVRYYACEAFYNIAKVSGPVAATPQ